MMNSVLVNSEDGFKHQVNVRMSDNEFGHLRNLIYDECKISLTSNKKAMLISRLNKRLKHFGMTDYMEYYNYLQSIDGRNKELHKMIDAVTTNKTEFFRESIHFDFMRDNFLPDFIKFNKGNTLKIWSAGCSTGEEPYTIAMVLTESLSKHRELKYSILATDISNEVLENAKNGIYSEEKAEAIPFLLRQKYLLRGKGPRQGFVRFGPELSKNIKFLQHNLNNRDFKFASPVDIIFCRNVIIYFDNKTKISLFKKFYDVLNPGGYMFIGNSESLRGTNDKFVYVTPSIYRKPK